VFELGVMDDDDDDDVLSLRKLESVLLSVSRSKVQRFDTKKSGEYSAFRN
jgi:hypothetical protein